jgi:hypothetical protein
MFIVFRLARQPRHADAVDFMPLKVYSISGWRLMPPQKATSSRSCFHAERKHVTVIPKQSPARCSRRVCWDAQGHSVKNKLLRLPGFSASCRHNPNRDKATPINTVSPSLYPVQPNPFLCLPLLGVRQARHAVLLTGTTLKVLDHDTSAPPGLSCPWVHTMPLRCPLLANTQTAARLTH